MSALDWLDNPRGREFGYIADPGLHDRPFAVRRHGEGRKYWEAHYPDGTHTDTFTTATAAKASCESWEVDASLVALLEQGQDSLSVASRESSTTVVETTAADESLPFGAVIREHLWAVSAGAGATRTERQQALKNVATLAQMRATVEAIIREQIAVARTGVTNNWGGYRWGDEPETWADIGKALGVSKQAAATRYGDKKS